MIEYSQAKQLLRPGESALIIFTRNENLKLDDDGCGRTGEWVINPLRRVDWIVIYNRVGEVGAELFLARPGDFDGPVGDRYGVGLRGVVRIGMTTANWPDFADGNQRPVRYLSREAASQETER